MNRRTFLPLALMTASLCLAQDLNTEIVVGHEVVAEQRQATRLRLNPGITLPDLGPGRLPMESALLNAPLTPFINPLDPAAWGTTAPSSPWHGYASLFYGPVYNLGASAGYRFVDRRDLTADAWLQFNGSRYSSGFPSLDHYDGKVTLNRNTGLAGVRTTWRPTATNGTLMASAVYSLSGYNYPILSLADYTYTLHDITANYADVNASWQAKAGDIAYSVSADYKLMGFGGTASSINNRIKPAVSVDWKASRLSSWGLDASFAFTHSSIVDNKGVVSLLPHYALTTPTLSLRAGVNIDIRTANAPYSKRALWAPNLDVCWTPSASFNIWGKLNGRLDDNFRGDIYMMQPYTLPTFDATYSRIYNGDGGITLGPWKGASISVFGGYTKAFDWYIGAIVTGDMTPVDMQGAHFGAQFDYRYRNILSLNVRGEYAPNTPGDYSRGYAPWRDHARFNLNASASVRPIQPLCITLAYQLRTDRNKMLASGYLNLQNINNLSASVSYSLNRKWTLSLQGENLINKSWYLGPSIPCQGIMGQLGASYKF